MGTFIIYTDTPAIVVGHTAQFTSQNAVAPISWSSSDSTIATISSDTGVATGVAKSTSSVTITATDSAGNTATSTLWVGNLTVTPQDAAIETGGTVSLRVTGTTGTPTWTSLSTNVATINSSGMVTGSNLGVTTIKVTDTNENVGYATVRVGTLLVYGADGTLYLVPPQIWAVAPIVPPTSASIPTFQTMNSRAQPSSSKELAVYVPTGTSWTTCYVLNPAPTKST